MIYSEFIDCENATIKIQSVSSTTIDPVPQLPVQVKVNAYDNSGIFYELSASEQVVRSQIQKQASGQVILNPAKVLSPITQVMDMLVTTDDFTDKPYRIVTIKNPLNKGEAIIIDIAEA